MKKVAEESSGAAAAAAPSLHDQFADLARIQCRREAACTLGSFTAVLLLIVTAQQQLSSTTHLVTMEVLPWVSITVASAVLCATLFLQQGSSSMKQQQLYLCRFAAPALFLVAELTWFLQNAVNAGSATTGFLLSVAIPCLAVTSMEAQRHKETLFFSFFIVSAAALLCPSSVYISTNTTTSALVSVAMVVPLLALIAATNALLAILRSHNDSRIAALISTSSTPCLPAPPPPLHHRQEQHSSNEDSAEEKLNKMRSFLSYVFHEIRVPFNAVMLGIGHLQASDVTSDQQETLQMMESSSTSMIDILNNVLDMGKIESGKFELELMPFNMGDIINSLRLSFKSPMAARGIRYVEIVEPRAKDIFAHYDVLGDKHRIRQVIANYLSNAAKFTPAQGQVTLRIVCSSEIREQDEEETEQKSSWTEKEGVVAAEGRTSSCNGQEKEDAPPLPAARKRKKVVDVTVTVEDTGIGISKEHQEMLFQPYMQIRAGATQDGGGTGLGLSFAKWIVELAGGRSFVVSEIGKGSAFSFVIPFTLAEVKGDRGIRKSTSSQSNSFKVQASSRIRNGKAKVLVIEDSLVNRKILRKLLDSFGIETHDAENGERAIQIIQEGASFDLILVDKEMPKMDGHEVTRRLRAMGVKSLMIGLSGNALISDRNQFLAAGVDDFYTKPMSRNQLVELLEIHSLIPKPKEDEQNMTTTSRTSTTTNAE